MDPLVSLLAVETAGIVDAETMVKGVEPPSQSTFPLGFLRGSFCGSGLAIPRTSPFISPLSLPYSIALSHLCLRAPLSGLTVISVWLKIHWPNRRLCALHVSCTDLPKLAYWPSIVDGVEQCLGTVSVAWPWTQSSFLFR